MAVSLEATVNETSRQSGCEKQFRFHLDEPQVWTGTERQLRVSGWCVAKNGQPLSGIRARIGRDIFDGAFEHDRPDVLAYLEMQHAPRCCGFACDIELPAGKSHLVIEVCTGKNEWRKVFVRELRAPWLEQRAERHQREQGLQAATQFDVWFDRPRDWSQPTRVLYLAGWCVERSGQWIRAIRARVGGAEFYGTFGIERKDVAAVYPTLRTARHSGFGIAATLPRGRGEMIVEVEGGDCVWREIARREVIGGDTQAETLAAGEEPLFAPQRERDSRLRFWFDRPGNWRAKTRHVHLAGWALAIDGEPLVQLRARVGRRMFCVNYGILRPDIAVVFEGQPRALQSGFAGDVRVPPGGHEFVLEGRSARGPWEPLFTQRVRGPLLFAEREKDVEAVGNYREWIRRYDTLTRADRRAIKAHIAQLEWRPRFSVLLPTFNTDPRWLRRAIKSVRAQLYPDWELCIVDDASTDPRVWKIIERFTEADRRINAHRRATNGHISAASNDALALATGEYIALLDHDDELTPHALYFAAVELNRVPDAQVIYSDEDKLDARGRRTDPYFKPDWNPDLFSAQNYVSHLGVYNAELVRRIGGFRVGFEGSQDYDLLWRCTEQIAAAQIRHIPRVLYHWRVAQESTATFALAKPYAQEAAIRAAQEHFERSGVAAEVERHYANYLRVRYGLPAKRSLVSLIITTRDRAEHLRRCVESILAETEYQPYEMIVIDNDTSEPAALDYLQELQARRVASVHRVAGAFNFSRLNNIGVTRANGSVVALLNNDLEVKNGDWLDEMVSHALRPEIGAVGARLWYPDGTMQHGGVILGSGGVGSHAHAGIRNEHGYFARAHLTQNFSAVTAACLVTRKAIYENIGGLDETNLPVAFNDVDFCLRLQSDGLRVVWTPHAELFHYESASRGLEDTSAKQRRFLAEVGYMEQRWGEQLARDPAYNPNLSLASNELFKLAFPPRVENPWEHAS